MLSIPQPLLRAMAAGFENAAALTEGRDAPALLESPRFELLQLSSLRTLQILGCSDLYEAHEVSMKRRLIKIFTDS